MDPCGGPSQWLCSRQIGNLGTGTNFGGNRVNQELNHFDKTLVATFPSSIAS